MRSLHRAALTGHELVGSSHGSRTDRARPWVLARRLGVGRGRVGAPCRRARGHGAHAPRPRVAGRRPLLDHALRPRRRDRRGRLGGGAPGRPRRAQRLGRRGLRRQRPRPRNRSQPWSTWTPALRRAHSTPTSPTPRNHCPRRRSSRRKRTSTVSATSSSRRSASGRCLGRAVCCVRPSGSRNDARLDIPSTAIATGFTSDQYKDAIKEGYAWLGGFADLRDLTWVDLPTSHWPMWSRPKELADVIGEVARRAG